jgi:hypothetical protein
MNDQKKLLASCSPIYKVSMEEARCGAVYPGDCTSVLLKLTDWIRTNDGRIATKQAIRM